MTLSAADLQKRHELEGAPDPFPSLPQPPSAPVVKPSTSTLDTGSEIAFPSLVSATPSTGAPSAWGGPRIKAVVTKAPVFTDTFTLSAIDLSNVGKDGKAATLGEVIKQVIAKYKVKIEASANQVGRQTTFHVKSESQKELDKAKRSLLALCSPVITHVINAPASTIASIIGPKGATLKQIRDQTSVRVDIPKRDPVPAEGNGHVNGTPNGKSPAYDDDDDEEPSVPVTLTGPQPLVFEAQELLQRIISSKTSRATQRVRDIPVHILPFVVARRPAFVAVAGETPITLTLNAGLREITANGDREAVTRVVDTIKQTIQSLESTLTSIKLSLPKRQHRLLIGPGADAVMQKSHCSVVVGETDEVTVWGEASKLPGGLGAVMEQANSKHIAEVPIPGSPEFAKQVATYIQRIQYAKVLKSAHPNVTAYLPGPEATTFSIDLLGEKADVDAATKQIAELFGKLLGGTREVRIDWLLHRVISGKNAKKMKQFHDAHNVNIYFPSESVELSSVLLVYDPLSPSASSSPDQKSKHLEDVERDLLKMAKEAADVKSQTIPVEKRWHEAVVGKNNTTLNAIIGEDTTLSIKVGADVGDASTEDIILVRGVSEDVDRAVKEIYKIVEDAKNDEIVNSHVTEFEIEREYVGRVVGAQGSGVNKLRDQLGVRVDVSDEVEEGFKESSKKKKTSHQKSKIKITGRKENVEEAKKRISAQIDRLADETSEILKIPAQYHSSLIGQSGKYAIRLEEKYSVKITFPRQSSDNGENKTREQLKPDEVLIKGGKKGVAGAKNELVEAVDFEKEQNNSLVFTVPTRAVARILGRGGASINEIKDSTEAQIDIEKNTADTTSITVRGTKKAIQAAKTAILSISDQVSEEATVNLTIESRFHRNIIGMGGQGLKDLIKRCGGPSDPKVQASLVRFPRQGEPGDEVRLRGEPKLVTKVQAELEQLVATLRDRVILGVEIPAVQHRALIGRGGQHLNELQEKFDVQVQFPGSRSYHQVGEPENAAELSEVDPANIVKVSGSRQACEKALGALQSSVRAAPVEGPSTTVAVPLKYVHSIAQQGGFFRTLRSYGVQVDQSGQPQKSGLPPKPAPTARIDDESPDFEWDVVSNYQDADEEEATWTLKARDQAGLTKAEKAIQDAITDAARQTHVGYLTLPDRAMFPKIVGSKGANVARLRNDTGADITVSRDNNTIVIVGSESAIIAAKDAILRMTSNNNRDRRRND